jgi:hypothetical protein
MKKFTEEFPNIPDRKIETPEYRKQLNSILRTSMKISESVSQNRMKEVQLWTILLNSQIEETLQLTKELDNE